jgi:hypothetical protein
MKRIASGIIGLGLLLALLASFQRPAPAVAGVLGAYSYLPLVLRQPTRTPTQTPPATATATRTPTAASTNVPAGVTILGNHSSYTDSIDYLHIVGEVFNNSGGPIRFVKIIVDLYNGAHQFIGTDFTYTWLSNLPNADRTCFDVLVDTPAGYASYEFEAVSYSGSSEGLPNLALLSPSGSVGSFGYYHLIGQVRNDMEVQVKYVQPVGTLYTANGTVADCDFTFVQSTHLSAGQTSAFDIAFISRPSYADVTSWRLQVDGDPQ